MKLAGSLAKAQAVTTARQAAHLYNDLEQELALGNYTEADADEAEEALALLEANYPGVRQAARNVTTPPKLSRGAWSNATGGNSATGGASNRTGSGAGGASQASGTAARRSSPPSPGPGRQAAPAQRSAPAPRRSRSSRPGGSFRGSRAIPDPGGWGSLIGELFVWGMGLSLAYLLLTRAAIVGKLAQGAATVARGVVSPHVDPLNPKGA